MSTESTAGGAPAHWRPRPVAARLVGARAVGQKVRRRLVGHRSAPADPLSVDDLITEARAAIGWRPGPADLDALVAGGALVVDIRPVEQRARDGELPGAVVVDRNVLEWRLDPASPHRIPETAPGRQVVIVCNEGYQSSLAAATLRRLGLDATDLAGGHTAWRNVDHRT